MGVVAVWIVLKHAVYILQLLAGLENITQHFVLLAWVVGVTIASLTNMWYSREGCAIIPGDSAQESLK